MHLAMLQNRSQKKWFVVTSLVAAAVLLMLNLLPSPLYMGNPKDNLIKGPQTDLGWPYAWYSSYPNGYIHPWELLPHEVTPRTGILHPIGVLFDAIVFLTIVSGISFATIWLEKRGKNFKDSVTKAKGDESSY